MKMKSILKWEIIFQMSIVIVMYKVFSLCVFVCLNMIVHINLFHVFTTSTTAVKWIF